MKKSLVPLIISLSLVVLLTTLVVNTRPEMRNQGTTDSEGDKPNISLNNNQEESTHGSYKPRTNIMDRNAVLNMLVKAYTELHKGNIPEAEDKVRTVLIFQPENNEALSLLGKIYYLKHEYKKAEMIFRQQARINRKSAAAYNNLGQVLLKQNKCALAALQFQVAQGLDPGSGLIALNLSGAYSLQGKKQDSLKSFKRAFELLGPQIVIVANHSALDNIRHEQEFQDILRKAYDELAAKRKKADKSPGANKKK